MDERAQIITDFQDTFGTQHGKRVMEYLKKICHYDDIIDCDDAMILSKYTGERNVYVSILNMLKADPNQEVQTEAERSDDDDDDDDGN